MWVVYFIKKIQFLKAFSSMFLEIAIKIMSIVLYNVSNCYGMLSLNKSQLPCDIPSKQYLSLREGLDKIRTHSF